MVNPEPLLPAGVVAELLRRWSEPHRYYHSTRHLEAGLGALALVGGGPLERVAFWFHDAVHTGESPSDEAASAELARRLLAGALPDRQVDEVARLVMVTATHDPLPGDSAGCRVADADLSALGAPWAEYARNLEGIREERPDLSEADWIRRRRRFVDRMLARAHVFGTHAGRGLWEPGARRNLRREADQLSASSW